VPLWLFVVILIVVIVGLLLVLGVLGDGSGNTGSDIG
jgi:hypothetical protein